MGEISVTRVMMSADAIGGVWTYAVDLSRALSELGIEVVMVVMGRPLSPEQHREAATVSTLRVYENPLKLEWMDDPWRDLAEAERYLLELERREAPDVVHLNSFVHAVAPFRAPKLVVAHSCVLSWWRAVKGNAAPERWSRYQTAVRAGLLAADSVVAPTRAMLDALEWNYGLLKNAHVISNGIDLSRYSDDFKEPFIFAAGRMWDEAKNLDVLSTAAKALPWPVYLAGETQRPPGISEGVREQQRPNSAVHPLGVLSRGEMTRWLSRASIYAHPARYEPFGLSVLEAAASGCALVLGDIPSLRELWDDAALFADPSSPRAVRASIESLISDSFLRDRLGRAAKLRSRAYGLCPFRDKYIAQYAELAGNAKEDPRTRKVSVGNKLVASRVDAR